MVKKALIDMVKRINRTNCIHVTYHVNMESKDSSRVVSQLDEMVVVTKFEVM